MALAVDEGWRMVGSGRASSVCDAMRMGRKAGDMGKAP